MPHSTGTDFDQSRIYLVIDQGREDLTVTSTRRSLLHLQENLIELEWTYDSASGGFGPGTASAKVPEGSWGRRQLDSRNYSTAHIYWSPPETEGPVLMSDYDAKEGEFLLWSGFVSDVDVSPKSDIVGFTLMGLGEFVSLVDSDRSGGGGIGGVRTFKDHATTDASAISQTSWILDNTISGYYEVMSDGAMLRKVLYSEGRASLSSHSSNLAELLGGHPLVAWGIRNNGGASGLGQYYFSLVADPGREQTSSDTNFANRSAPYISPLELVSVSVDDDTSSVINAARVFRPWDGIESSNILSEGVAENTSSINRIGRREKIISDSSIEDTTQAADRAAAFVAANSSPEIMVRAEILHDPRPISAPNAAGETYLPLLSALKDGTIKIPIPFQERGGQDRADRGDALTSIFEPSLSDVVALKQDTPGAATMLLDCRTGSPSKTVPNAPSGLYSGSPDWKTGGDLNASATVTHLQMKWTDTTELADGAGAGVLLKSVAICEWDRQIYFSLNAQGTTPQTYAPYLAVYDTSGVWTSAGTFSNYFGTTITKAQLLGGIDLVLSGVSTIGGTDDTEIDTFLGRIYTVSSLPDDPSGLRSLLWYGGVGIASTATMSSVGDRALLVNKSNGTGIPAGSAYPQLSKSVEVSEVSVYGSLGETVTPSTTALHALNGLQLDDFADEIVYQQPLYKNGNKLLIDTHIGCSRAVESDDVVSSNTKSMIHLAYANTGSFTNGGDFCHVVSSITGSGISTSSTAKFRKHNAWLLGPGDTGYAAALGPDLTVTPRQVTCSLEGGKIRIMLEGNGRPTSATYKIQAESEELDTVLRNQRVGQ